MVRICLIAFLTSICYSLQAQKSDTICLNPILFGHQNIKQWSIPPSVSRLYSWGEFSLKRLGTKRLEFTIDRPGDTVKVLVTNKDGIPFKKVSWKFGKSKADHARNTAVYEWKGRDTLSRQATLGIKIPFSLNRQVAKIQISSIAAANKETITNSIDTLLLSKKKTIIAIKEETNVSLEGKGTLLTAWKCQRFPLPGITQIETGSLQVERHPALVKKLLPSGPHLLPRLFKTRAIPYADFKEGDTLIIAVQSKAPVKRITLKNGAGAILNQVLNTAQFNDTIVATDKEGKLILRLRDNFSLKKNYADVLVTRLRPVNADSAYIVTDTTYKKTSEAVLDTLLLTICDDILLLSPTWNIESNSFDQIAVQIPKEAGEGFELMFAAYWIGIGRNSLNDYLTLEATVPPDWGKPGASLLLSAFGLGRPLIMPVSGVSVANEVLNIFSKNKRQTLLGQGQKKLPAARTIWPGKKYTGILSQTELANGATSGLSLVTGTESYNFFACFQNTSTVNTWPISVKVVGFYRKSTIVPKDKVEKEGSSYKIPLSK